MKKYQDGGKTGAQLKKEGMAMKAAGKAMKAKGAAMKYDANKSKRESYMLQSGADDRAGNITQSMKTGGMVNSNAKVSALKSAGSKGVKSGVNPKATASKVARGRVGGTSAAPKTATPKMKMGGAMKRKGY